MKIAQHQLPVQAPKRRPAGSPTVSYHLEESKNKPTPWGLEPMRVCNSLIMIVV